MSRMENATFAPNQKTARLKAACDRFQQRNCVKGREQFNTAAPVRRCAFETEVRSPISRGTARGPGRTRTGGAGGSGTILAPASKPGSGATSAAPLPPPPPPPLPPRAAPRCAAAARGARRSRRRGRGRPPRARWQCRGARWRRAAAARARPPGWPRACSRRSAPTRRPDARVAQAMSRGAVGARGAGRRLEGGRARQSLYAVTTRGPLG